MIEIPIVILFLIPVAFLAVVVVVAWAYSSTWEAEYRREAGAGEKAASYWQSRYLSLKNLIDDHTAETYRGDE